MATVSDAAKRAASAPHFVPQLDAINGIVNMRRPTMICVSQ